MCSIVRRPSASLLTCRAASLLGNLWWLSYYISPQQALQLFAHPYTIICISYEAIPRQLNVLTPETDQTSGLKRSLTHGRKREVVHAPWVNSPLCCLILLGGFGVEPTYHMLAFRS